MHSFAVRLLFTCLFIYTAGVAFGAPKEDRLAIEFWHGMSGAQAAAINSIADKYNASQDRYRVTPIFQGQYNQLSQKLIASCYARRNPAISQMYPGWSTRFYRYGYLTPAGEFAANDPNFGTEQIADFYPVMIAENTLKNPETGEKELVTLPFNKSVYVLYVNQTLMEKVGWNAPPKTWDEFEQLAEAMTEIPEGATKPTRYGFAARPFVEDYTVQAFAAGVQLVDEETGAINVDSERALEALKFLKSLVSGDGEKAVGYIESSYLNAPFGSERIGMYIASTASFPYNDMAVGNKFVWMAYAVPKLEGAEGAGTLMQGTNVGIFSNVSEEEQAAAWDFAKFLTGPAMTAFWAMETGYLPVRQSARDLPEFHEYIEKNRRYANAVATLDSAVFEPRLMYWESVRQILSREVEAVLLGRRGPEEAMASARDAIATAQLRAE